MFKDKAEMYNELQEEISNICTNVFNKISKEGLILHKDREYYTEENKMLPVSEFKYRDYDIFDSYVVIKGSRYLGCGEYDFVKLSISFDEIDDINKYISKKRNEIIKFHNDKHTRELELEKEKLSRKEKQEYEEFLRLNKKFKDR